MLFVEVMLKTLKQTYRSKSAVAIIIIGPIVFFSFFGLVFGTENESRTRTIGFINEDIGYDTLDFSDIIPHKFLIAGNSSNFGNLYVELLKNHIDLLVESPISLSMKAYTDYEELRKDVEIQVLNVGIIIPKNFTEAMLSGYNDGYHTKNGLYKDDYPINVNTTISVLGDLSVEAYRSSISILYQSFTVFTEEIYGIGRFVDFPIEGGFLDFESRSIYSDEYTMFHFFAPGFLVFLIILQMINIANLLVEEKEKQTINRIKLALLPEWILFLGLFLAQFVIVSVQIGIAISILSFWGLTASALNWMKIFIILQVTNFNVSGLALIISSFVKTKDSAGSATGLLSAPIGFLSGAFLPVPEVYVIKALNIQIWDILPTYHSNTAVTKLLLEDAPLSDLTKPIVLLSLFAIIWFTIGLLIYRKRVLFGDT
ncbi:MAG: ABC transporter permease [Candidatus Kariarchaeaceae archaeon]|jgi:ABC-type multidrug transport system permease subunit